MLTLHTLLDEMGLDLARGEEAAESPLRWVHITELEDPTPWLSGGELILTTGLQLTSARRQREFVRRLADHQLAGLGLGTGFTHDSLPQALMDEAGELGFPLFAVPYELPFIALTEKAFTRLVNEQYAVLQRSISIHKRLERLVLEERGLDAVVRALSAAIGGAVMVLDARGETLARREFRRPVPADAYDSVRDEVRRHARALARSGEGGGEFVPAHPEIQGRSVVAPVSTHSRSAPQAWLLAARDSGGLGDFERLILQQAVTVVALEMMRRRAMSNTERRLAGDVLAEALTGRLAQAEVEARLRPFGLVSEAAVLVFGDLEPSAAEAELDLDRFLRDAGVGALVASREQLLCAVVDARNDLDPLDLAGRARERLTEAHGQVRVGVSRPAAVAAVRQSFHEARCAFEASALANGSAPKVASYRDLGAFQLLLSLQDDEALQLFCESVLGPLADTGGARSAGGEYGEELTRSLEAFLEHNGQWEKAARDLYCHRHTLRYRIRRIEELTGRDLRNARDRIEFWLALRGRELIS